MLPKRNPPTVDDIKEIPVTGPWRSKSGGELSVPFALPHARAMELFSYDEAELARIPRDIRGLRMFALDNVPIGGVGGGEFHRIRSEIAFTVRGRLRWVCEDLYGGRRVLTTAQKASLYVPPFILHTMEALEHGSAIVVIANTLYDPDDISTHDTYAAAEFRKLQEHYLASVR